MALVSTFPNSSNGRAYFRKIETGLEVNYSRQRISGSWSWDAGGTISMGGTFNSMIEYHRRATKRYRYVGMTEYAKKACVRAMHELYTRNLWTNFWDGSGGWSDTKDCGRVLTANVAPVQNDDGSWDVEIDVNEDDIRYSLVNNVFQAKDMFGYDYETVRDYDGETEDDL